MSERISNTSKTIKGLSTQSIITIGMGVIEVVAFSILSRLLSKVDFGYFASITAITSILVIFSEAGIGAALIQRKELDERYANNAFTLSLLLGLSFSVLLFIFSPHVARVFIDTSMTTPLRLISITILLHSLTSVNTSIMHRQLQFLKVGLIRLSSLFVTNVIAIVLAIYGLGYYAIIVKAILDSVLSYALSAVCVNTRFSLCLNKELCRDIFAFSGWLTASSVFRNIAHQVDKLLMPRLLSVELLGAYNRPKEFINHISGRINSIFDVVLFPVLSSINDNHVSLRAAFNKSIYLVNVLSAVLFLGFISNTEFIIRVFFGEEWLNLAGVFRLLSVAVLFNVNGRVADCYLRSLGLTKDQFFFRIVETFVTLAGVIIGSRMGMIGVAAAVVITDSMMKLVKICYVASRIQIKISQVMGLLLKSWRFMVVEIPLLFVGYLLMPQSFFGCTIYFLLFMLLNGIIFIFTPSLVGEVYIKEFHWRITNYLSTRIKRKSASKE